MNFTSYSQIEQAYNQLQFDLALSENTSLFSEMHNYISENIVELPYCEDVFTEAKDGKNFLERIWDFIVGIWNAIKKFVVMIFRAARQLFTGKSENDKLIETLENNSEEIADNIQNKPAAEVVKVLTELFVSEKKSEEKSPEVKKESAYLSEAKAMDLYNAKVKEALERLATNIPKGISFKEYLDNPTHNKEMLNMLNNFRRAYGLSDIESIPKRITILMRNRLAVNSILLDLADLIYSDEGEKYWNELGKSIFETRYKDGRFKINDKNDLANLFIRHKVANADMTKGISMLNNNILRMILSDKAFSGYLSKIQKLNGIVATRDQNSKYKTINNWEAFDKIWRSLDISKILRNRGNLVLHQIWLLSFVKTIEDMDTIIAEGPDDTTPSISTNHLTHYFKNLNAYFSNNSFNSDTNKRIEDENRNEIFTIWGSRIKDNIDSVKPAFQGMGHIDIKKYKAMIAEKVKPALKVPVEEAKGKYDAIHNMFSTKANKEALEPKSINDKPLYYLPDTYANNNYSLRTQLSNSLLFYLKEFNYSLNVLNGFRGQINLLTFKRSLLSSLQKFCQ